MFGTSSTQNGPRLHLGKFIHETVKKRKHFSAKKENKPVIK